MKKILTAGAAVVLALILAACGADVADEPADTTAAAQPAAFDSEDAKLEAFMRHICKRDGHQQDLEPEVQAAEVAVDVLSDERSSAEDRRIALDITTRPDGYAQDAARAEAAGEPVPETAVPRTLTPEGAGTCSGWVWEQHLNYRFDEEFEDFTAKDSIR